MKKLFSMMLMLCAIVTFSACSSDDDPKDSCPVSDVVVPSSAKIGSEVTVQGKGFTTSQHYYLAYSEYSLTRVELKDVNVSTSGVTFTVPYTAVEGQTMQFSITDGDKDYNLGSITILAADMPVSALSIPSQMPLLEDAVSIIGTGFVNGDEIGIKSDTIKDIIYLDTKVVDGGVEVNTTTALEGNVDVNTTTALEGNVDVYLRRGNSEWKIGRTYTYKPRVIKSITISDNGFLDAYAAYIGLNGNALKLDMEYDKDYALQKVTSNCDMYSWELSYSGNTVSFTSVYGLEYSYTLDDNKRIVSSVSYDMYGDPVTYTWNYNADGYLVSITSSANETVLETNYADGNLQAYTFGFLFSTDNQNVLSTYPATVEPVYLLNSFTWMSQKEDLFIGFLINQNVKISRSILSQFNAADMNQETGEEVYKTFDVASELGENTLTLETKSDNGVMSGASGLYTNKVVVNYDIKSKN